MKVPTFLVFVSFFHFAAAYAAAPSDGYHYHPLAVDRRAYVVQIDPRDPADDGAGSEVEAWHRSFLPATTEAYNFGDRLIHSYKEVFSGFAAWLTDGEADHLRAHPGVVRLQPDGFVPVATTRSPGFLGLRAGNGGIWSRAGLGKGAIIGILDTGILPSHLSFADHDVPPPPARWRGTCEFKIKGQGGCNNKIIGARAFGTAAINPAAPPLDDDGHGTHTASTAAGNFVSNASFLGNADGTASGMAPHAHLAVYKVCSRSRCSIMDIIAGMDAAVKDGVDVMSMSIGASPAAKFNYDLIATAAFKAVEKGIFVSCAAGNDGPTPGSIQNEAPWVLTVAAGTMDRTIRTTVRLGDGQEFEGESLYQPSNFSAAALQLVYPGFDNTTSSRQCSVLGDEVARKMVLCESPGLSGRIEAGMTVSAYGGAAMILMNQRPFGYTTFADPHVLPASHVSNAAGEKIMSYIRSTKRPTARILFKGTVIGASPAPTVAYFSSRGPGKASPGILKPDITGPGMNILAGWAPDALQPEAGEGSQLPFRVMSGTSMSTPHLSGIVALIKGVHPSWSPAAIKSAIMTTSETADNAKKPIRNEQLRPASSFTVGAGFVSPLKAVDPGLVYDLSVDDYIAYLCGKDLGDEGVTEIVGRRITCSKIKSTTEAELNYPSMVVNLRSMRPAVTVRRMVTNVGKPNAAYRAVVDMPNTAISVTVSPLRLVFSKSGQKLSFTVKVARQGGGTVTPGAVEGSLRWVSDDQTVRTPIVITG